MECGAIPPLSFVFSFLSKHRTPRGKEKQALLQSVWVILA
jgi:hypothetical protein